jgi:CheY-like chemotaxis protein
MSSIRSIIVIDDEMELALLFKSFLEKEGYDVVSFVDPLIALDFFKETSNKHSLVITDLRMPGICGIDLAIQMRKINKNIHIFLMTAFETKDLRDQENFRQAGFDRLIQKPVRFADLRNMINELWTNDIK